MTSKQIQILVSGSLATLAELLGKIAAAPPELQMQIPQMFQEQFRGTISMVCQTIGGIAFVYALFVAHRPASDLPQQNAFAPTPKSVITTKLTS